MTKLAPEWVRTSDPVIRSPARYRWTAAPAHTTLEDDHLFNLIPYFPVLQCQIPPPPPLFYCHFWSSVPLFDTLTVYG